MKIKILLFICIPILIAGCSSSTSYKDKADITDIQLTDLNIQQYERDLFTIDQGIIKKELQDLSNKYPLFLGNQLDTLQIIQISNYLNDPILVELYQSSLKKYPNLDWLEKDLNNAYKHIKYYFPKEKEKSFFTYISGIDLLNPVFVDDNNVIIAIDMYLGKELDAYKQVGIPLYKARELDKDYILIDILYQEAYQKLPKGYTPKTILDFMIHEAKAVMFCDLMLPHAPDSLKMKYTDSQMKWCNENESNLWAFMIENQLLYNSDKEQVKKLILEAPYTAGFSEDSPGKIGIWLGWNILKSYLNNNPNTKFEDLLLNTDSQEILEKSGYRPRY